MKKCAAFTLAEVMVVMLILSIILAAFAPMMTSRKKVDISSPWKYASNNSDAYFGLGSEQTALIGLKSLTADDPDARFAISTSPNSKAHILFKNGSSILGQISFKYNNLIIGGKTVKDGITSGAKYNTVIGVNAMPNNTGGSNNTALGYSSMGTMTADYNTGLGYKALNLGGCASGYNTAVGANSMAYDTACYFDAPKYNTALGYRALYEPRGGNYNVALGYNSLASANGSYNTVVGSGSLAKGSASYNTVVGYSSLSKAAGSYNTAIGSYTFGNAVTTDTTGHNTAIGYYACRYVTGSNKTCLGAFSGPGSSDASASDTSNMVYIGTAASTVYIPGNLVVGKNAYLNTDDGESRTAVRPHAWNSGVFVLEKESNDGQRFYKLGPQVGANAGVLWWSDKRLKNVKDENKAGLEQINKLKIYDYTFKKDKKKTPHVGVIAQDLQKIFPNAVIKGEDGYLLIRQEDMFFALINAVKELDMKIREFTKKFDIIQAQNEEIKMLKKQNLELEARVKIIEEKLK